jgi:DNA processing protein
MSPEALRDHLHLALVPGLGPKLTQVLLDHFGSASAALCATQAELERLPSIGAKIAQKIAHGLRHADVQTEYDRVLQQQVQVLVRGTPEYPHRLLGLENGPPLLYLQGTLSPRDLNAVGIVGSRSCTSYGRRMAERIATGLVRAGWTVISGLARGIDGVAHQSALNAGGRTIAVMANGLSSIYPPEHDKLAAEIAQTGALLTETPMTVKPQAGMFPARNRIISGLSRGIVVIEASERSGALITATHAAEQGREVFAVPGPADSIASAGCLELIRKGARMVRSADDILEDLQGLALPDPPLFQANLFADASPVATQHTPTAERPLPAEWTEQQRSVWAALSEPRTVDDLSAECQLPVVELTRLLMTWELKKYVRRLPGNQYERHKSP